MKHTPAFLLSLSLLVTACTNRPEPVPPGGPNILLIITDDQGYGDLGYHGNPYIRTPVLDELAARSTRIDPFYVCPVCAPTRASLMTGRYHLRTGVFDTYNGGAMMAGNETTLPEVLRENGYHTAMIGKWHLGDAYPMRPMDQGYDYSLAHKGGGIGQPGDDFGNFIRRDSAYFDPWLWENGKRIRTRGYCSDVFTDHALTFIEDHVAERDDPFFIYLAFNAPHTPLQLPARYLAEYAEMSYSMDDFPNAGSNVAGMQPRDLEAARRVYGMVSNIDDNLGRLLSRIRELGIEENTLIVFLTDNGPQQRRYVSGMSGRKGSVLEGGIRVPCFFYWKGTLEAGRVVDYPAAHIDMMPTLLSMAGISYEGDVDGIDVSSLLAGEKQSLEERPLFFVWVRGYPQKYTNMAVRKGDYKLVGHLLHDEPPDSLRLYNLEADPNEQRNLSRQEPSKHEELREILDQWHDEVMQSPNLLEPPRIAIGTPEENPVILNRNDWKGPTARRWNASEAYGYWDIEVFSAGRYDIRMVCQEPLPGEGIAYVRSGVRQYWIRNREAKAQEITLKDVFLDTGRQSISGWYTAAGGFSTPFYIEVIRKVQ